MVGFTESESAESYHQGIVLLQKHLFPDVDIGWETAGTDFEGKWEFYLPSFHFKKEYNLMNEQIVDDLRTHPEKRILDACCGPAYLERLLAHIGVRQEQIALADISSRHIPSGFAFYQFDIFKPWPSSLGHYDYVLFPAYPIGGDGRTNEKKLYCAMREAVDVLLPKGQIRLTCALADFIRNNVKARILNEVRNVKITNAAPLTVLQKYR